MHDRGKTIEDLKQLAKDDWILHFNDTDVKETAKAALAMLKEQEAVPVIRREIMHMLFWCCGSCGVAITDGDKFCRMCGKAVKWDGSSSEIPNS